MCMWQLPLAVQQFVRVLLDHDVDGREVAYRREYGAGVEHLMVPKRLWLHSHGMESEQCHCRCMRSN